MDCKIQWIDDNGKGSPDTNQATHMAQFHTPIFNKNGSTISYTETIREEYPICPKHMEMVTTEMYYPLGAWSFIPIDVQENN